MKRLLFLTILSVLVMSTTYGRMISGVISDGRDGTPLIGAVVKNGSRGAVVDFDGRYRIEADTGDELSYSYVGYATVVKTVGSESIINVELKVSTGDEILDAMVDGMYEMKEPLEDTFKSQYGIDFELILDVDTSKREIVFGYEFSDKSVYDIFDIETGMNGALGGMIANALESDPSGTALEMIADAFEINEYNLRVVAKYGNYTKSGLITYEDIREKVDATFGD